MEAAAYLRVSTEKQDFETQRQLILSWAAPRGVTVAHWYWDYATSGATHPLARPGFRRLVQDLEAGAVRVRLLVVPELSRLARRVADLLDVLNLLEARLGVLVVSASPAEQAMNVLDPGFRQLIRTLIGMVAQMERELIRARARAAVERARQQGKIRNVAEKAPETVKRRVVEMYRRGASLRQIVKATGLTSYAVRRILSEAGLYRPTPLTCPRCMHRMRVVESGVVERGGRLLYVTRLRCDACGLEQEKTEG